jgi:hypothetical protein
MRHENYEKNYDIVMKLSVCSVPQNYYCSSKSILIFIALNRARTFMINDK